MKFCARAAVIGDTPVVTRRKEWVLLGVVYVVVLLAVFAALHFGAGLSAFLSCLAGICMASGAGGGLAARRQWSQRG